LTRGLWNFKGVCIIHINHTGVPDTSRRRLDDMSSFFGGLCKFEEAFVPISHTGILGFIRRGIDKKA
jgi:hypothetical protein